MYLPPVEGEGEEGFNSEPFVDRSALLRATLNSLAMTNVASVLNSKKHKKTPQDLLDEDDDSEEELEIKRIEAEADEEFREASEDNTAE